MAVILTSCGGNNGGSDARVKTQEVVLEDCVKIEQQGVDFKITEETDEGKTEAYLEVNLKVEALNDVSWGWGKRIKMYLFDKDGVELIYLIADDAPEKKGSKKMVTFGQTLATGDKTKQELNTIVSNTTSVSFEIEKL